MLARAFSAYGAGRLVEAERQCQRLTVVKPDLFDALHLLAVVQSKLGKKQEALASFDRALTIRPDHAEALHNRGNTLQELKRFDEALASYDKALALEPAYGQALNGHGNILLNWGRTFPGGERACVGASPIPNLAMALAMRVRSNAPTARCGGVGATPRRGPTIEPKAINPAGAAV